MMVMAVGLWELRVVVALYRLVVLKLVDNRPV